MDAIVFLKKVRNLIELFAGLLLNTNYLLAGLE